MNYNADSFIDEYQAEFQKTFALPIEKGSKLEKYETLVRLIFDKASEIEMQTCKKNSDNKEKKVYYLSMEFLIGRLLKNYLINLGIEDAVSTGLQMLGENLDELCEYESDPGLGNGGLGRLAACFLDSMAYLGIAGSGMGIRYRFGLFSQKFVDGYQTEEVDEWLNNGYPWEVKKAQDTVEVRFGGYVDRNYDNGRIIFKHRGYYSVIAVPYDVPIVGYGGQTVNTLRLWRSQPLREEFDLEAFNRGDYSAAVKNRNEAEAITCILYPDDSTANGKTLRLKQEYFFVSSSLTSILKEYKEQYGTDKLSKFPEFVCIHINDTHPAMCAPELMRLLLDEEGLEWDAAWDIVARSISFTNHTTLPEALEKWPVDLMVSLLPRVYMIIEEIDRRYAEAFDRTLPEWQANLKATAIIRDGEVRMANLAVISSYAVNGVAALHTDILKNYCFKEFCRLTPEKFSNKTNGVSHRRFMVESNPALTKLVTSALGNEWIRHPIKLEGLLKYKDDDAFLKELAKVKYDNKCRLAEHIFKESKIEIDPNSVFDIQVKRIHAYKRQLLSTFKIMDLYHRLKENPNLNVNPYTFIFGGKAAQGYAFAKETIKYINSVADLVNNDPDVAHKIKVVFIENFNVSKAQLIYPAAEISEQISTASKEASGTGNMKFMFNGAVTIGTLDGANVEIKQLVGDENICIFGLTSSQVLAHYGMGDYNALKTCEEDKRLVRLTDELVNEFFERADHKFWLIYDELMKYNDQHFVLKDFDAYIKAWDDLDRIYFDKRRWKNMSLANIAKAGHFSSDRAIKEYARYIWNTSCDY